MPETPFIVTLDTEGDDLWSRPREITTRNAAHLPRFQALCERFGFKPVYLVDYEMARCDPFVELARDVLARDAGEVGMHLHAWNSPPLVPLTEDDFHHQPYLVEYPERIMRHKVAFITQLLEDRFERPIVSHRAGRVGFDGRYAAILLEQGYRVDCSVTPGVDWSAHPGAPGGNGGTDYRAFPERPYFIHPADISVPAAAGLLEVPVTIRRSALHRRAPWAYRVPFLGRVANRLSPALTWVNPSESRLVAMLRALRAARAEGVAHVEFMLHSSELMPGGSPSYRDAAAIERLYGELEILFGELAGWCRGATLAEYHASFARTALQ